MSVDNVHDIPQMKPLHCELGLLTRPDGSAVLCQGDTTVIAAIYGPLEAKPQRMLIEKSCVEAHYRPKAGLPGVGDRLRDSVIRNTCETALMATLHPRTVISVVIQEVQDCGGLLGCSINAACLALLDSGIEMKYLVAAVTCMLDSKDNIIVDPSRLELEKARATFTFVFDSIKRGVVASHTTGTFTQPCYQESVVKCRVASENVFSYYRSFMLKSKE